MDLAHAALGHTELRADAREGEFLVVVQRQHAPLAVGHAAHRVGQQLAHLQRFERFDRIETAAADRVAEGRAHADIGAGEKRLVEGTDPTEIDFAARLREAVPRHAEFGRRLVVIGPSSQLVLEFRRGVLDGPVLRPNRSRRPVQQPQLIEDRTPDPTGHVGLELDATVGVELVDRIDEAQNAVAHEIALLDVVRHPGTDPGGHELHQRGVMQDQALARLGPLVLFVLAPKFGNLGA